MSNPDEIDELASWLNCPDGFASTCARSPAVKSVQKAFDAEFDKKTAKQKLMEMLIFLDYIKCVNAQKLRLSYTVDRKERKKKAIDLIEEAADLLDFSFDHITEATSNNIDTEMALARRKQTPRKLLTRIASADPSRMGDKLRIIASVICGVSVNDLMPIDEKDRWPNMFVDRKNIGLSGRAAASPESANNGLLIRELDDKLPVGLQNKYAVMEELFAIKGIDLSRQLIRGVLLKGRT